MARSSKDLAKRLRYDRFPRPDFFRRRYFVVGAALAAVGVGLWVLFAGSFGERQYLPGPVSSSHATFGERCENCHQAFRAVANTACLQCHPKRIHSEVERGTPACRDCHVEHRDVEVFLSVSSQACVSCHGALVRTRPDLEVHTAISTFADHPVFRPLREGTSDEAAIRFNHQIHLTSQDVSDPDAADESDAALRCDKCHRPQADGRYMQPIVFETHCRRCHEQKVSEQPSPISSIEAPHEKPETVRAGLESQLVVVALKSPQMFRVDEKIILPGRTGRGPIDDSKSLLEYQQKRLETLEAALYRTFDDTDPLLDNNKYCFLCHDGEAPTDQALAEVVDPEIPARWLRYGEFSHRKHEKLDCDTCHAGVEKSERTSDVNLAGAGADGSEIPLGEVCRSCHADGATESAGTNCMLCHLYHDTSKDPSVRHAADLTLPLRVLTGDDPVPQGR